MMFKKGDVVVWTTKHNGAPVEAGEAFSVLVNKEPNQWDEFGGEVIERAYRCFHPIGKYNSDWDVTQFKLKQEATTGNVTAQNTFPVLKDGMIVTTRGRGSYLIVGEKPLDHGGYNSLHDYTEEGEVIAASNEFDIVKVYSGVSLYSLDLERYIAMNSHQLIWEEQKNAKAIAEIEEQMSDLQQQMSVLQEKLTTLREEK